MNENIDNHRRRLIKATSLVAGAGLVTAAIPFISYMNPSARAYAGGAPVQVDISKLKVGQQITVIWQRKPVWILNRTQENLDDLKLDSLREQLSDPDSLVTSQQPDYANDSARSIREKYLVVVGLCTHLGCIPTYRPDRSPDDLGKLWVGGYYCPCHGSKYDLSGRVFKHMPAPINLLVPKYHYLSDTEILIGEDSHE